MSKKPTPKKSSVATAVPPLFPQPYCGRPKPKVLVGPHSVPSDGVPAMDEVDVDVPALEEARMYELKNTTEISALRKDGPSRLHRFSIIYQQPKPESQRRKRGTNTNNGGGGENLGFATNGNGLAVGSNGASRPATPIAPSLLSPTSKSFSVAPTRGDGGGAVPRTPSATTFLQSPQPNMMTGNGSFSGSPSSFSRDVSPNAKGGAVSPNESTGYLSALSATTKNKLTTGTKLFEGYSSCEAHLIKIAAFYKHIHGATLRVHEEISRNTGINAAEIAYVESRISAAFTTLHLERQREEAAAMMLATTANAEIESLSATSQSLKRLNTMAPRKSGTAAFPSKGGGSAATLDERSPSGSVNFSSDTSGTVGRTTRAFLKELTKRIPVDVPAVVLLVLTLYCAGSDDFEALIPRDKEDVFLAALDNSSSSDPDVQKQKVRAWLLAAVKAAEKVKAVKAEEAMQNGGVQSLASASGFGLQSPLSPAANDLAFSTAAFASTAVGPSAITASGTAFQLSRSLDELRIAMQSGNINIDETLIKWCGTVAVLASAIVVFTTPNPTVEGDSAPSSRPSSASESTAKQTARRKRSMSITSKTAAQIRRNSPSTIGAGGAQQSPHGPNSSINSAVANASEQLSPSSSRRRASSIRGSINLPSNNIITPPSSTQPTPSTTNPSSSVPTTIPLNIDELNSAAPPLPTHNSIANLKDSVRMSRSSFSSEGTRPVPTNDFFSNAASPTSTTIARFARGFGGSITGTVSPTSEHLAHNSRHTNMIHSNTLALRYRIVCPTTLQAVEHLKSLTLQVWANKFQTPLLCPMSASDLIAAEQPVPLRRQFGVEPSPVINSAEATAVERLSAIFEGWHLVLQPTAPTGAQDDPKAGKGGKGKSEDVKNKMPPASPNSTKKGGKGRKGKDEPVPMTAEEELAYINNLPTSITIEIIVRNTNTVPLRWFSNHGGEEEYLLSPLLRYRLRDVDVANLRLSLYADGPNETNPIQETNLVSTVFGALSASPPMNASLNGTSSLQNEANRTQTPTKGGLSAILQQSPQKSPDQNTPPTGKKGNASKTNTAKQAAEPADPLANTQSSMQHMPVPEEAYEVLPHQFYTSVIDDARKASSVANRMVHRLIEEFVQPHHCHRHASQRFSYFCHTCRIFICNACAREMHVSHKITPLKEFCQSEIARMHPKVDKLRTRIGRLKDIIAALGPKSEALHTLIDNGIDGVATTLERHRSTLHLDATERADRQLRQVLHERARCSEEQTRIAAAIDTVKTGVLKGAIPKPLVSAEYFQITNQMALTLPSHDITKLIRVLTWSNPSKYLTTTIYPPPEQPGSPNVVDAGSL